MASITILTVFCIYLTFVSAGLTGLGPQGLGGYGSSSTGHSFVSLDDALDSNSFGRRSAGFNGLTGLNSLAGLNGLSALSSLAAALDSADTYRKSAGLAGLTNLAGLSGLSGLTNLESDLEDALEGSLNSGSTRKNAAFGALSNLGLNNLAGLTNLATALDSSNNFNNLAERKSSGLERLGSFSELSSNLATALEDALEERSSSSGSNRKDSGLSGFNSLTGFSGLTGLNNLAGLSNLATALDNGSSGGRKNAAFNSLAELSNLATALDSGGMLSNQATNRKNSEFSGLSGFNGLSGLSNLAGLSSLAAALDSGSLGGSRRNSDHGGLSTASLFDSLDFDE